MSDHRWLGGTNRHNDISTQFWEHFHCRWISEWWLIWSVWIFAYRQSMRTFSKPLIGGLVKRKSVDFFINRNKFEWCGRYGNRARIITLFDLFTKRYAIFCIASSSLPNPYRKCWTTSLDGKKKSCLKCMHDFAKIEGFPLNVQANQLHYLKDLFLDVVSVGVRMNKYLRF